MSRALATVCRITEINEIPNADFIVHMRISGGWNVVSNKSNKYNVGDLCVFIQADSLIPLSDPRFSFLEGVNVYEYTNPETQETEKFSRIRVMKLRKCLSEGLTIPFDPESFTGKGEGDDVTEDLNILYYERESYQMGDAKGDFPKHLISQTGLDRIQISPLAQYCDNSGKLRARECRTLLNRRFEEGRNSNSGKLPLRITEKIDGTSLTTLVIDGELSVSSREIERKDSESSLYWQTVRSTGLDKILLELSSGEFEYGFQGEIYGKGVQTNAYKLPDRRIGVYNVVRREKGANCRFTKLRFEDWPNELQKLSVPVLDDFIIPKLLDELFDSVNQLRSKLGDTRVEGIVVEIPDDNDPMYDEKIKILSTSYIIKHDS